jgi:dolichol-phosphate mannosyltransferase
MRGLFAKQWFGTVAKKLVSGSQFATIGVGGLIVNQVLLWLLFDVLHFNHLLLAAAIATQGSTTFNFIGTEAWVFSGRQAGGVAGVLRRFLVYDAVNSTSLLIRLPLLQLLYGSFHINYLVANLITLVALTVIRFVIADSLIWRSRPLPRRAA